MPYYEINNPNEWWSTQSAIFIAEELVILCIKISQNYNGTNGFGMKITFDNSHKLKSTSNVYRKIVKNITMSNNVAKILHCIADFFASLFLVDKLHYRFTLWTADSTHQHYTGLKLYVRIDYLFEIDKN